jgi:predicted Zn-dependent peptidase
MVNRANIKPYFALLIVTYPLKLHILLAVTLLQTPVRKKSWALASIIVKDRADLIMLLKYWKTINKTRCYRLIWGFIAVFLLGWGVIYPPVACARTQTPTATESIGPYLERAIAKVTEFRLDNGMKFIVLERHEAPVVSFITYADVGGADEPNKKTGVAHFLEHLAFKGTTRISTKNWQAEKPLLERLDRLAIELQTALKTYKENDPKIIQLRQEFDRVEAEAAKYQIQNEYGRIVEQAGGTGLNAATSADATVYFYSFPANKLELWMSLESERFLDPVFREFYREKEVILEERRLRTDNSPSGQLFEAFQDAAFQVHPYKRPIIGYSQDIQQLTREDVQQFFDTHYIPNKLTMAIVGDVNPKEVKRLAEIYFGRYQAQAASENKIAVEPPQTKPRQVELKLPAQPVYIEGYHRPGLKHPDNVIYEIITSILSDGRTSRLYQALVEKQQLAVAAEGFNGFPGNKYPTLIIFYTEPAPDHTIDEVTAVLQTEIDRLKSEPVSELELERVKKQARVALLKTLNSNMGMAENLVEYEVKTGSWRNLFQELDAIASVTPADIQRVAKATFTPENRTVGKISPQDK